MARHDSGHFLYFPMQFEAAEAAMPLDEIKLQLRKHRTLKKLQGYSYLISASLYK